MRLCHLFDSNSSVVVGVVFVAEGGEQRVEIVRIFAGDDELASGEAVL